MARQRDVHVSRGHGVDEERGLTADVYRPLDPNRDPDPTSDADGRPVVVFVFGGSWVSGEPTQFARWALDAVDAGFVAVAVSYRHADDAPFPAQIRDVRAGIRWVRRTAAEFGGDPDRVGAVGHSAGAHLAVLTALAAEGAFEERDDAATDSRDHAARVDAVVGVAGLYDLRADADHTPDNEARLARLFGANDAPAVRAAASPLEHVDGDAPPTLLLHGEDDAIFPVGESARLAAALSAAGAPVEFDRRPESDHTFLHSSHEYPEVGRRVFSFLDAAL